MQSLRSLGPSRAGAFLSVMVIVAACGGSSPTTAPTAAPGTQAPVVTAAPPTEAPTDTPPDQVTGSLTVFDWAGYDQQIFWQDFADKYKNVTVSFPSFGGSDADIYTQVKTGANTSDIFHPYSGWLQLYVDAGLVAEIDTSKLKNWDKVPDSFKKLGQVNGKQYFVPWDWGFTSVLYRTDKISTVDSWATLTDPTYNGHIMMWDDGPGAVTVSSYIHGWDETQITPDQLAQIKTEWTTVIKNNPTLWLGEPELVDGFENGNVWAAYAWQGAFATLTGDGKVPVAYANPKEGRNSWVGFYGIRADSPNYDLALRFLDEKLGDVTGKNLIENYYYGTVNADAMAAITDQTLKDAFSLNDPSILEHTRFTPNVTEAQRQAWTEMWTEVKAAAGVGG
jgi:spermidine/putrescine transport system substrate-binding protein